MGGSSGSGGSSGAVSYPEYMQTQHETWLDAVDAAITIAVTGDNPYTLASAYDPDCVLNATNFIMSQFNDVVVALDPETDWGSAYDVVDAKFAFPDLFSTTEISDTVDAVQADLEARRDQDFKPAYKIGMQNVNAVMSSSCVIGDEMLTAEVARNVATFAGDLNIRYGENQAKYKVNQANVFSTAVSTILNFDTSRVSFYQAVAHLTTEANRIKIVAKSEENAINVDYTVQDAIWDLEMYAYGVNMLAGIGGGTVGTNNKKTSTGASVLGGAMSGAAAGASISGGNPLITGAFAIAGGIAGLLG